MTKQELEEDINIGDVLKFKTIDKDFIGRVETFGETGVKITSIDSNKSKRISYDLIKEYDFDVNISCKKDENSEKTVSPNEIQELAKEKYGNLAGIAQQYLFYWRRAM